MPSSPRSSITRISSTLAIGFVAAALAACSGTGDALGEPAEANDDVVVQQEQPQQDDGANPGDSDVDDDGVAGAADDADGGNAIILPARTIDATVYVGGLEYTIGEVRVLDLDDEAGRLPQRTHGLQVDIDVEAFNPTDSQSMVNLMATLSWVDPESGLLHQGFGSPPQGAGVPGGGRANLALEYQVDGMEVDTFSLVLRPGRPPRTRRPAQARRGSHPADVAGDRREPRGPRGRAGARHLPCGDGWPGRL